MHHCMMAFRRQCTGAKFFANPYAFFTTRGLFVSSGLHESIDFYGHVDQFTFLRSEGGGGSLLYFSYCMVTTLLNQAHGINWGCSLRKLVTTSNCSIIKGGLLPF